MGTFLHKLHDNIFFDKKMIVMDSGHGRKGHDVVMYHTIAPLRNKQHPHAAATLTQDYRYNIGNINSSSFNSDFDDAFYSINCLGTDIGRQSPNDSTICPHVIANPYHYGMGEKLETLKTFRPEKDTNWHPCQSETFQKIQIPARSIPISLRAINAYSSDIDGLSAFKGCFAIAASVCDPEDPWMCHNFMFIFHDDTYRPDNADKYAKEISSAQFVPTINDILEYIFVEANLFKNSIVPFDAKGFFKDGSKKPEYASVTILLDNAEETMASLIKRPFFNGLDEEGISNATGDLLYDKTYLYKKDIVASETTGLKLVTPAYNPATQKKLSSNFFLFKLHFRTPKIFAAKDDWRMEDICRELSLPMPQRYDMTTNSALHCWVNDPDRFLRNQWELTQLPLEYCAWMFGQGFRPPVSVVSLTNPVSKKSMYKNFPVADENLSYSQANYVRELNYRGFYYPNPHDADIPYEYRSKVLNGFNYHAETVGTTFTEIAPITWFRKAYGGGLNACYRPGYVTEKTYDYDLSSAYPVALSLVPDVQWYNNSLLGAFQNNDPDGDCDQRYREEQSTTYRHVIFNRYLTCDDIKDDCVQIFGCRADFPDDCYQPNFRDALENTFGGVAKNSYIFPQCTHNGVHTQYEVQTALRMGATVFCTEALEIPLLKKNGVCQYTGFDILRVYMRDRETAKKNRLGSDIFKLSANSQYGKMAQDVSSTSGVVKNCFNPVADPYRVATATALVRSIIAEAVTELVRQGFRVYSATTDGFITNAPYSALDALHFGGMKEQWESTLCALAGNDHSRMWTMKHQQDTFLNVTTRFNVALNEDGVCAHGNIGTFPGVEKDSDLDRIHTWNQAVYADHGDIPIFTISTVSYNDVKNFHIPYFRHITMKRGSANFDGKRQPVFSTLQRQMIPLVGDEMHEDKEIHEKNSFDTRPWKTVEEYVATKYLRPGNDIDSTSNKQKKTNRNLYVSVFNTAGNMAAASAYLSAKTRRKTTYCKNVILDTFVENIMMHCMNRDDVFMSLPISHDENTPVKQLCVDINEMVGSDFATTGTWATVRRHVNANTFTPLDSDIEDMLLREVAEQNYHANNIIDNVFCGFDTKNIVNYDQGNIYYVETHFPGAYVNKMQHVRKITNMLGESVFSRVSIEDEDFLNGDYWHAIQNEVLSHKKSSSHHRVNNTIQDVMKGGASPEVHKKVRDIRDRQKKRQESARKRAETQRKAEFFDNNKIKRAWEDPFDAAMRNQDIIRTWRNSMFDKIYKMKRSGVSERDIEWYRQQEVFTEWAHRATYSDPTNYARNKDVFMVLNRVGKWGSHFYGESEWLVNDIISTIDKRYITENIRDAITEYAKAHEEWFWMKNNESISQREKFSPEFLCDKTPRLRKAEQTINNIAGTCHMSPEIHNMCVEDLPFHFYRVTRSAKAQKKQLAEYDKRYFLFATCELF